MFTRCISVIGMCLPVCWPSFHRGDLIIKEHRVHVAACFPFIAAGEQLGQDRYPGLLRAHPGRQLPPEQRGGCRLLVFSLGPVGRVGEETRPARGLRDVSDPREADSVCSGNIP